MKALLQILLAVVVLTAGVSVLLYSIDTWPWVLVVLVVGFGAYGAGLRHSRRQASKR